MPDAAIYDVTKTIIPKNYFLLKSRQNLEKMAKRVAQSLASFKISKKKKKKAFSKAAQMWEKWPKELPNFGSV
jgi:hypothetical protein